MNSGFPSPEEFEEFLRKLSQDGNASNPWGDLPPSLAPLQAIFESLQGALANSNTATELPVDWSQALATAQKLLAGARESISGENVSLSDLQDADRIARSWVAPSTHFDLQSTQTNLVRRVDWPELSLGTLKLIAGPIAERSGVDAIENFREMMPGQPEEFYQMVSSKLAGVASQLHGIQLGHLLAALTNGVLIGSEFGLVSQQAPMVIIENAAAFADTATGPRIDSLIYLTARELLTVSLFDSNPWIRESLATQFVRYASHLTFNSSGMQEIQRAIESSDFDSLSDLIGTMVNVEPSAEQVEARAAIQHIVALINGWTDSRVLAACSHLTNLSAIDEAYRRQRATDSPMSKAFRLLLGIEFQAVRIRTAADFWTKISEQMETRRVDELWLHPDLIPTESEVSDPSSLLRRLASKSEDDLDAALRKLLDGDAS